MDAAGFLALASGEEFLVAIKCRIFGAALKIFAMKSNRSR